MSLLKPQAPIIYMRVVNEMVKDVLEGVFPEKTMDSTGIMSSS